jgi:hypothetical protein
MLRLEVQETGAPYCSEQILLESGGFAKRFAVPCMWKRGALFPRFADLQ